MTYDWTTTFLQGDLNRRLLEEYASKFNSKALGNRVKLLINSYGL